MSHYRTQISMELYILSSIKITWSTMVTSINFHIPYIYTPLVEDHTTLLILFLSSRLDISTPIFISYINKIYDFLFFVYKYQYNNILFYLQNNKFSEL